LSHTTLVAKPLVLNFDGRIESRCWTSAPRARTSEDLDSVGAQLIQEVADAGER